MIVQGRTAVAFCLGFLEISIWLMVITATIGQVRENPWLGLFYALGFAAGNALGIKLERRLAFGHTILRVITRKDGDDMASVLRERGHAVTTFQGRGMEGPVTQLYIVCRRRDVIKLLELVRRMDPKAFFVTEMAGNVSNILRPTGPPSTGWRSILKKK